MQSLPNECSSRLSKTHAQQVWTFVWALYDYFMVFYLEAATGGVP